MFQETAKRSSCIALAGIFAVAMAGAAVAAPLPVSTSMAKSPASTAGVTLVRYHHHYRHHYHHYRHYRHYRHYYGGFNPGAAIAGTALGIIGGAAAAASGYPYGYYGYGYPYYNYGYSYPYYYGYGPGYYGYW
jgi:hypothetical protein